MSLADPSSQSALPEEDKTHYKKGSFLLLSVVLVVGIFASTLPQPSVLGRLPLLHILKGKLHSSPDQIALFFLICGLFWYLKPIAGILTDAFPLFKTRRRYYLLFSSVLAAVSWILLGAAPHTYKNLLYGAIVVNLFMVMMSTVVGAFLVEVGQSRGLTGKMTGIRQVTMSACSLISGPISGFLAMGSFMIAAGVNAVMVLSIFPIAFVLLKEKKEAKHNQGALATASEQLNIIWKSRPFWMSISFILLFYFTPGFGTLQYFRQNDILKLTQVQIGYLGSVGGFGGILGSFAYIGVVRRLPIRTLLIFGVITSALATLFYLFYNSYPIAFAIDFQSGLFGGFAETALIDLAARGTPAGCEGLGYSLMMSARNLSLFGADYLGSKLSDVYHVPWSGMVSLNAGTTAIVLVLLPFMPKLMMGSRDQSLPNTENTGEPEAA
jgi:hypothetical protein